MPIPPVITADRQINKSVQFFLIMYKPKRAKITIIACGQRCQMHNLHGSRLAKISNENALMRSNREPNPEKNKAFLNEIFN